MITPYLNVYIESTVLSNKYGGANVGVTKCMSHFYMFASTNSTVKLANGNIVHAKGIGIIIYIYIYIYIKMTHYISSGTSLLLYISPF